MGVGGEQERDAIQRGLRPQLLAHVIRAQTTTVDDVLTAAGVAEAAHLVTATSTTSGDLPLDKVIAELAANRLIAEENTQELRKSPHN